MDCVYDVAIIGGGINGCGCAADAALRGLSVFLCEQDDLASKTSSSSTKLIHGGLRYLEYFDFALVKKALDERQNLLRLAPHLVHPLPFVLPHQKNMRPIWFLRTGLFLYDHLSRKNKLPKTKLIKRRKHADYFEPLNDNLTQGFLFYDAATDDARLTITNALQAKAHGATIMPQTKLIQAQINNKQWQLTMQSKAGYCFQIKAKTVINAAGPWVEPMNQLLQIPQARAMTLIKGSHLVVQKLYEGEHAYLLQHEDNRIVFVIPYHGYSMIGTTDVTFTGSLDDIDIEPAEITYLTTLINNYFKIQLHEHDIISRWSGVRPLLAEAGKTPNAISRDYAYHFTHHPAPSITIYSGKITTYRQLSKHAIDQLRAVFPDLAKSHTETTPLPGANLNTMRFENYKIHAREKYHWLDEEILTRYLNNYGTRTELILSECKKMADLGINFTNTLYQVEVDYLQREEWAINSDDILWRRTKLGLNFNETSKAELARYMRYSGIPLSN